MVEGEGRAFDYHPLKLFLGQNLNPIIAAKGQGATLLGWWDQTIWTPKAYFATKTLTLFLQLKAEGGGTAFGYPSPGDYGKLGEAGMYGAQDYAR